MGKKLGYDAYITSNAWRAKRLKRLAIDGNKCQGCGSKTKLHVHHRTYIRFGGEELMDDLVTVCEGCHALIHKMHSLGRRRITLDQATEKILKQMSPSPLVATVRRITNKRGPYPVRRQKPTKGVGWERDSDPTWIKSKRPKFAAAEREKRRNGL